MAWETIRKTDRPGWPVANLDDYEIVREGFSWAAASSLLRGLPDGGLNLAFEAVDRHLEEGLADKVAIRWLGRDFQTDRANYRDLSYGELAGLTSRFAHLLEQLDVAPGERVFSLLGRVPELYVAALGTLKAGRVFSPLFSAFGPEPVRARMTLGDARVLVTTAAYYERKVAPWRQGLPGLRHVLLTDRRGEDLPVGTLSLADALATCPDRGGLASTRPEDMALLHFTSGTTGKPKGAIHVHGAVLFHVLTGRYALDLHPADVFWCTADPGWVTGTSYGIIAPLAIGATLIVDEADLDPVRWFGILQDQRVTVWYTAPTAIRMLMKVADRTDKGIVGHYDLSRLRFLASVGEPLNPEGVMWGQEVLGLPFHDNWWQTETGGIMIANYRRMDIKPGSMGKPLPGVEAAIVRRLRPAAADTQPGPAIEVIETPDTLGELALRLGWPAMFRGYLNEPERYAKCFADGWYLTGDLAQRDADGYYWFVGRADDVIKSAGHLIGPFEVESVLMEHPAVAEAAAIGVPEPTAGEVVKALVALKPGFTADEGLRKALLAHARKRLGPAVAPREIDFRANLPKTRSGKIMRRLLRARELGLPEGDLSTLESDER
ncbi:MAG: acetate--CoA ligase [Gammaproteobacteria bacterium]|nr:acetate--CoA ligase [Gammaproteobacteria bacterium]